MNTPAAHAPPSAAAGWVDSEATQRTENDTRKHIPILLDTFKRERCTHYPSAGGLQETESLTFIPDQI
jgi:hypothetical protein